MESPRAVKTTTTTYTTTTSDGGRVTKSTTTTTTTTGGGGTHTSQTSYQLPPKLRVPQNAHYTGYEEQEDVDVLAGKRKVKSSNCTGRKRALLIGINYFNTPFELKGCINDVQNVRAFLINHYGFKESDLTILTDNTLNPRLIPNRENIIREMKTLIHGSQENDSFFLHFSGHGGQVVDTTGDEDDGYDETLMPLDFQTAGQITDDEMHEILVKSLPHGVRLTVVFDSCHSGTALDLPYIYSTKGNVKSPNLIKDARRALIDASASYLRGDLKNLKYGIMAYAKKARHGSSIYKRNMEENSSEADVVMFSGCKDLQTSADTQEAGQSTGAMSYALTKTLNEHPNLTYSELLNSLRDILASRYSQKPQLSAAHPIDLNSQFII